MLGWSFVLLAFVQCVAGLVVSSLCWDFIESSDQDAEKRHEAVSTPILGPFNVFSWLVVHSL